ncbi:tetratricopeptide repeat protein [Streptomyces alkaliterrae]|uniref:tetratricopeptide repeat protein n=1 Tax=Streptomyces alkaliterrae TaxID=2213162 RepID=UPI001E5C27DE|nr:tetratricopeptide repeat protein [Streptomyces alkaliterrae]
MASSPSTSAGEYEPAGAAGRAVRAGPAGGTDGTAAAPTTGDPPPTPRRRPNEVFRRLRGQLSPGEFAATVRRAAREIGEQVSCDARYIGRVESGEIRCPNYAYERVFRHMFPGYSLVDMGFCPREAVRGRSARRRRAYGGDDAPESASARPSGDRTSDRGDNRAHTDEESDVLRRAFMTGGSAALATASLYTPLGGRPAAAAEPLPTGIPEQPARPAARPGRSEAASVAEAVRQIRLLDDRHGADRLYQRAGATLRRTFELLDAGARHQTVADQLGGSTGELAISVGWLAHDSERFDDARSHYAEALSIARFAGDAALEAHAFCNTSFLARDAGRPREALRAAQAGQQAARRLGSYRLQSLLALREAGGWSGLGDRAGTEDALGRATALFDRGPTDDDPEWMTFFGAAELAGLEAQAWSALGDRDRAARRALDAVALQPPQFVRNTALFTAQLAGDLVAAGSPEEAASHALRALDLLRTVHSSRVRRMLHDTAGRLSAHRRRPEVAAFLERVPTPAGPPRAARVPVPRGGSA